MTETNKTELNLKIKQIIDETKKFNMNKDDFKKNENILKIIDETKKINPSEIELKIKKIHEQTPSLPTRTTVKQETEQKTKGDSRVSKMIKVFDGQGSFKSKTTQLNTTKQTAQSQPVLPTRTNSTTLQSNTTTQNQNLTLKNKYAMFFNVNQDGQMTEKDDKVELGIK